MNELTKRFEMKIRKRRNGCIEWTACVNQFGYGRFNANGKLKVAHRFAWELKNGSIPEGLFVLHKCDNPKCVNVEHLFLGTYQDNSDDKIKKGRYKCPKGSECVRSKLTEKQILEIREIGLNLYQREIAEMYGITKRYVGYILNSKSWKHLSKDHDYKPTQKILGKRVKKGEEKSIICSICKKRIRSQKVHKQENENYHKKCIPK